MRFKEWLQRYGYTYREFAEVSGIDHTALFRYAKGERQPTLSHAITIERLTEGKVSVFDLSLEEDSSDQTSPREGVPSELSGVPF